MMDDEFPHEIQIEYKERIPDGGGGWEEKWVPLKTTVAHVQPISGQQYYFAQQMRNPVELDVYTPYDTEIRPQMRVIHEGAIMPIEAVLDQGGMAEILLLKCSRGRSEDEGKS